MTETRVRRSLDAKTIAGSVIALSALLGCANGCTGEIGGVLGEYGAGNGGPESSVGPNGTPADPSLVAAPAGARRLSTVEIKNSIRDVFAVDVSKFDWATFPSEGVAGKQFDNHASALATTANFTEPMQSAAEWAGQAVADKLATLLPCAAAGQDACAGTFIDTYAPRTYRRPITTDERAGLLAVYTSTRTTDDFGTAIATVVEAMLQSPSFLYRTELGAAIAKAAPLAPYELASALSYFFWSSAPDQQLLSAAAAGKLATSADLKTQAERLLADPRAADAASSLFQQWLGTGGKLTKVDGAFNAEVNASMMGEVATFVRQTVWSGSHGFTDLFTSPRSYIDANVAALYGVPAPNGSGLVATALDPGEHGGFFTMPGFIATYQNATYRSPIQLGHFVRTRVFCQELAPPPNNIPQPPSDPNLDVHGRFEQHTSAAACAGCHKLMDPIGYGWSRYDVMGRLAPVDHGVTEDGAGTITGTDVDGAFTGPVDLGKKIATSKVAQECFAETVLRWSLGRSASRSGTSSDVQAIRVAKDSGFANGDVKALFAMLVTSDSFRFRDTSNVPKGGQ